MSSIKSKDRSLEKYREKVLKMPDSEKKTALLKEIDAKTKNIVLK